MDLERFLVVGLDPKKADYAACTFRSIKDASRAVWQYGKLGVSPLITDLTRVFANAMSATPTASSSLIAVTPTAENPTSFRVPRWLVLAMGQDNAVVYDVATDYTTACAKAQGFAKQGLQVAVVSTNSALMTDFVRAYQFPLPPRVDRDVAATPLSELRLPPQFIVAVPGSDGPYDPAASDGIVGLDGRRWQKVVGEFDDPLQAFAAARSAPRTILYDRDNDYMWGPPWDAPATVAAFASEAAYLKFERWAIERDIRGIVNNAGTDTVDGLIVVLRTTQAPLRRSGQTGWDRAADWLAHARAASPPGEGQGEDL